MRSLKEWPDLLTLLKLSEQPDLDFKEARSRDNFAVEARKDIAALANTLGGHIIVGASTDKNRSRCTGFHGMPLLEATALAGEYENEAKACRPTPFISSHCIDHPETSERVVLVISVGMSPVAPVGASLQQPSGGQLVDEGWCFPYRVGSHTRYLSPDQFGAYESMSSRRSAALLSGIPTSERARLGLRYLLGGRSGAAIQATALRAALVAVSMEENVARFVIHDGAEKPMAVPLDEVVTVWRDGDDWQVALKGYVALETAAAKYYSAC